MSASYREKTFVGISPKQSHSTTKQANAKDWKMIRNLVFLPNTSIQMKKHFQNVLASGLYQKSDVNLDNALLYLRPLSKTKYLGYRKDTYQPAEAKAVS